MVVLVPLVAAAAVLIGTAGLAKLRSPLATAQALSTAGVPHRYVLVRLLGGVELAVAVGVLATGAPGFLAALGICYAGFAGFLSYVLMRGIRLESCGCAGSREIPPTRFHVVLNAAAAAAALAAVATAPPSAASVVVDLGLSAVTFVLGTLAFSYLLYVAAVFLPTVVAHPHGVASLSPPA
ncbi:MAG: hypothetical protein QOD08_1722 [Gaiellaceae bacterium]|jgi:hypothetical protein|nr:hypothetical protein [Gaiellaceae bacterium]MDX6482415.1 hypothetical protein [Gaiellaceae bacterium]